MKLVAFKSLAAGLVGLVAVLAVAIIFISRTPSLHTEGAVSSAVDAYIYGYRLVTFDMARRQQTNVAVAGAERAPMGQLIKMRSYPAVDNHCCAAPNADTLYTLVWLDVSGEPWVFRIPDMGDRYCIMPMLDGFSSNQSRKPERDREKTTDLRDYRTRLVRRCRKA